MKYDREEEEIINAFNKGELEFYTPSKKEIEEIKNSAKNTFKKNKRITIRLYEHDYNSIQKKALEMGIPYQTLISGLIHGYVEGNIKMITR